MLELCNEYVALPVYQKFSIHLSETAYPRGLFSEIFHAPAEY